MYDLVISGKIADAGSIYNSSIAINKDNIVKVADNLLGRRIISLSDSCIIFPGFIDLHVHAREDQSHKWDYKEDYQTAGDAAINGGVTAFLDRPNTPFPATTKKDIVEKQRLSKKCKVHVYQCAGVGEDTAPIPGHEFYKIFLAESNSELFFRDVNILEQQIKKYKNAKLSFHCELHDVVSNAPHRPAEAEISAIENVIELARKHKLNANICHLSTKMGMILVNKAKKEGLNITCEITPHHIFFDRRNVSKFQRARFIKMNPPLREGNDRKYLLKALKQGKADFLATDHAPHTVEEKQMAVAGVPHLDTYGNFVTWLIKKEKYSTKTIAKICSINPAKFLGVSRQIKKGSPATLTVLDLKKSVTVKKENLKTRCRWSPFEGVTFPGTVKATIIDGKIFSMH